MIKGIKVLAPVLGNPERHPENSNILIVVTEFEVEANTALDEESTLPGSIIADNLQSVTLGKLKVSSSQGKEGGIRYFATAVDFTDLNPEKDQITWFYVESEDESQTKKGEKDYTWPGKGKKDK